MAGPALNRQQEYCQHTAPYLGGGGGMSDPVEDPAVANAYWGEGRGVLRRPEVGSSILAESYVIRSHEEAKRLSEAVFESVKRRRELTDDERAARLQQLLDFALQQGITQGDIG